MATSGNTNVQLTVEATTLGGDAIRALADQVRALGKTGGDAGPEFAALAEQLDRVAAQASAVETFGALEANVRATTTAVDQATQAFNGAKTALDAQAASTATFKASQAEAADALNQARVAAIGAKEAFGILNAEVKSHSEVTATDTERLREARIAVAETTAEVARQRLAMSDVNDEVSTAEKLQAKLSATLAVTTRSLSAAQAAADTQAAALERAAAAAQALDVDTAALGAEQSRLLESQQQITTSAVKLQQAIEQQAEASRVAAEQAEALRDIGASVVAELEAERAARVADAAAIEAQNAAQAVQTQLLHEYDAAVAELNETLAVQRAAQEALIEAQAEQAESDRLANIQLESAIALRREGVEALAQERAALQDATYSNIQYDQASRAAATSSEALAQASRDAAEALQASFAQTGVRSIEAIRTEMIATEAALEKLSAEFEQGNISAQDMARAVGSAEAQLQKLRTEASRIPEATGFLEQMNASVIGLVNRFGALSAAAATVGFAFGGVITATEQLQQMQRVLTEVYGSTEAASAQILNLQVAADKSGVSVKSISDSFVQFAVSAKAAGISTQTVQDVFNGTVKAAGDLGLSSERVKLILEALGQMANKGVVSMEELRRQLGNSLPGALALMANSLGITTAQLTKMVASGQLLTSEVLEPLALAMTKFGSNGDVAVQGLAQSFNRLENAVTAFYQKFEDTTAYTILNGVVSGLASNFNLVIRAVTTLGELWAAKEIVAYISNLSGVNAALGTTKVVTDEVAVATGAATVAEEANTAATTVNTTARIANAEATIAETAANKLNATSFGDMSGSIGTFGRQAATTAESASIASRAMSGLGTAARGATTLLGGLPGIAVLVALNARELGTAIGEGTAKLFGFGKQLSDNEAKYNAQTAALAEMVKQGNTVGATFVQLTARYNDLIAPLTKAILAAEKHAEAVKLENQAMVSIAALTGDATVKVDASAKAAAAQAAAYQAVADKLQLQASATASLIAGYQGQVDAGVKLNSAEQQKLQTYQQTLLVQQAAVEKAQAEVDSQNLLAAAAFNASVAARDQSASLVTLQAALQDANDKVATLKIAQALGVDVTKQLTAAASDQAQAQSLVAKALQDTALNASIANDAVKNGVSVATAATNATIAFYQAEKAQATAIGDTTGARQADIAIAREQSDLIQQQITLKNADIANDRTKIATLQGLIDTKTGDTRAEQAAIDALKAKILVEQQETSALGSNISALDAQTAALEQNTTTVDQNAAAKAAAAKADAGTTPYGNLTPTVSDNTGYQDLQNKINAGTLGSGDLAELQAAIGSLQSDVATNTYAQKLNPGLIDPSAISSTNAQLLALTNALTALNEKTGATPTYGPGATPSTATPSTATSSTATAASTDASTSHTVTVNLNGASTTINAASASDATALAALVQQLALAASTASTS